MRGAVVFLMVMLFSAAWAKDPAEKPEDLLARIEDLENAVDQLRAQLQVHEHDPSGHHARYTDAESVAANRPIIASAVASHAANAVAHHADPDPENVLGVFRRTQQDVYIEGANLHVQNGVGQTDSSNGLGNVIIGYNELRQSGNDRTGSHMLVVGKQLNYTSYGGIVEGELNTTSGAFASVTGGQTNTASGINSSVTGGVGNEASGNQSSVTGGADNTAGGLFSSVTGGRASRATGIAASVSGGSSGWASGASASVSGGRNNIANASNSSVSGGNLNTASGITDSSVSGGKSNTASGIAASISGGAFTTAAGENEHPNTHTP